MTLSQRSSRALVVCGLLVVCPALFVSLPASSRPDTSCAALKAWAQTYRGASLTLEDMARFDRSHRRAVFNVVTPERRAALWQEHLGRVGRRSDLSAPQLAIVQEAITLTTPALYDREPAATRAFTAFWRRAEGVFPPPHHRGVWFDLGPVDQAPKSLAYSLLDRLSTPFVVHAQNPPCECNFDYPYHECDVGYCPDGGCVQYWGCGPGWAFMCTGRCAS